MLVKLYFSLHSNNVTLSYELDSPAYVTIIYMEQKNYCPEKRVMKSAGTNTFIWDVKNTMGLMYQMAYIPIKLKQLI